MTAGDVQDICQSAVKELELERKLNQVIGEWNHHSFTLETFKARGELLLDVDTTLKITSQLEDSLVILTSLSSSRYSTLCQSTKYKLTIPLRYTGLHTDGSLSSAQTFINFYCLCIILTALALTAYSHCGVEVKSRKRLTVGKCSNSQSKTSNSCFNRRQAIRHMSILFLITHYCSTFLKKQSCTMHILVTME